jgi:hypothetical protein
MPNLSGVVPKIKHVLLPSSPEYTSKLKSGCQYLLSDIDPDIYVSPKMTKKEKHYNTIGENNVNIPGNNTATFGLTNFKKNVRSDWKTLKQKGQKLVTSISMIGKPTKSEL